MKLITVFLLGIYVAADCFGSDGTRCPQYQPDWVGNIGTYPEGGGVVITWGYLVDVSGNVYVTGGFGGIADLDPTSANDKRTAVGLSDGFLTKINADGSYAWTYQIGGEEGVTCNGVASTLDGEVVVAGR